MWRNFVAPSSRGNAHVIESDVLEEYISAPIFSELVNRIAGNDDDISCIMRPVEDRYICSHPMGRSVALL
jgi:hypothetical protein